VGGVYVLRLWCVCAAMDPFAVMLAEDAGKEVEKVEVMGERVDVAVAKKEVVGEEFVDEVVEVALVVET
jgi:hypothetical protein